MVEPTLGSFWDAIRWWASSVGLLASKAKPGEVPPRPPVPEGVCASCPICQAAATLEQVDPKVMSDLTIVARSVMSGLSAALADAAMQRTGESWTAGKPTAAESTAEEPATATSTAKKAPARKRTAEKRTAQEPATRPSRARAATPKAQSPLAGAADETRSGQAGAPEAADAAD
ncbi:MAG: hypothetical protein WCF04_08040 [Candidatus Nanopelagicales bacterium]